MRVTVPPLGLKDIIEKTTSMSISICTNVQRMSRRKSVHKGIRNRDEASQNEVDI
jgi:hypothetical protein